MVYPTLTDNFNLATLNANFLELYNQMNVKQSYIPTASNLGTISIHKAIVKSGIGRYKLRANTGTWTAGTNYTICTLPEIYRPTNDAINKVICLMHNGTTPYFGEFVIGINGVVAIRPYSAMSNLFMQIDETYVI